MKEDSCYGKSKGYLIELVVDDDDSLAAAKGGVLWWVDMSGLYYKIALLITTGLFENY